MYKFSLLEFELLPWLVDIFFVVNLSSTEIRRLTCALIISVDKSTEKIYTEIKSMKYSLFFHGNTPELPILQK
jgi:hypothetical protein